MPESDVMPIGEDGQFFKVVELIWIEDEGRRRISTKDGRLLFDSQALVPQLFEPAPRRPEMTVGRVLEFNIHRFGHLHTDEELRGIRNIVCEAAASLKRPLRIVDTFGWSGEAALALCRVDSDDIVTIVDDLSGLGRSLEPWKDWNEHWRVLRDNLGPLLEFRIQCSLNDAAVLPMELTDEFDLVYIDRCSHGRRMEDLIDSWEPLLSDDGFFVGVSESFAAVSTRIRELTGYPMIVGPVSVLSKANIKAWHALREEADVA